MKLTLPKRRVEIDSESDEDEIKAPKRSRIEPRKDLVIAPQSQSDVDLSLPMLLRNQLKGMKELESDSERFKFDMSSRPDENPQAYEDVGIEEFGAALLRGMGWRPDEGVGSKPRVVKPVLNTNIRPNLLGLGAVPKPDLNGMQKNDRRSGASSVWLCNNALVKIINGRFQGEYAVVVQSEGVPGLNNIIVQISPGTEYTSLSRLPEIVIKRNTVELVNVNQLDKSHAGMILVALSKEQEELDQKKIENNKDISKVHVPSKSKEETKKEQKEKHECWLMPGIRVRIMSRSLGDGKYYKKKGVVNDVLDPRKCTCTVSLDESRVYLDKVHQHQVDTALPKEGGSVVVVLGDMKGQHGKLVERKKGKARIQLDMGICSIALDDVAEYCFEVN